MRTVLTDRGRAVAAAGVTLATAGLLLGFEDLTRLGLVAVCTVALAAALAAAPPPHVEVEAPQDGELVSAGTRCHMPLRLWARRRTPPLRLEQPLPVGMADRPVREFVPALTPPHRFTLDLNLTFPVRGRYVVRPCRLIREDPFGFAARGWSAGQSRTITVLPRIHDLPRPHPTPRGIGGPGHVPARWGVHGEDPIAIRDYAPGDDLRRIHWPATAHRGELMTRHEDGAVLPRVVLALDPGLADGRHPDELEWAVEMLASVAAALADVDVDLLTAVPPPAERAAATPVEDALLTLALLPSRPGPGLHAGGFAGRLRDRSSGAATVVLLASGRRDTTAELLTAISPTAAGLVCLVEDSPARADLAGLADLAVRAGWRARTCTSRDGHAAVWSALTEGA